MTDKMLVILLMFFILVNLIGNNVSFATDPFLEQATKENKFDGSKIPTLEDAINDKEMKDDVNRRRSICSL